MQLFKTLAQFYDFDPEPSRIPTMREKQMDCKNLSKIADMYIVYSK